MLNYLRSTHSPGNFQVQFDFKWSSGFREEYFQISYVLFVSLKQDIKYLENKQQKLSHRRCHLHSPSICLYYFKLYSYNVISNKKSDMAFGGNFDLLNGSACVSSRLDSNMLRSHVMRFLIRFDI